MSVWLAISLTLIASTAMNMGLVFLKKGLVQAPADDATVSAFLGRLVRSRIWCLGMAMLVGGYGLYVLANSARSAPISLLQPIFAFGLLVVALMAVVYLRERLGPFEWVGVCLQLGGVVLLAASAEETPRQDEIRVAHLLVYLGSVALVWLMALTLVAVEQSWLNREVLFGVLAGLLLGTGYLATKALTQAWYEDRPAIMILALAGMGAGLLGGLVMLQLGYRRGRALIVTAVNLVINQVMVVIGGLFCLGESFPEEPFHFYARVSGLAAIFAGTLILCRFGHIDKRNFRPR
jgi:drug/metabolite transporter (DMT)-like permease